MPRKTVHIIGAGWSGLSAAVHAIELGFEVHLYESRAVAGGRASSHLHQGTQFDHGQHILIAAYAQSRALIRKFHPQEDDVFQKLPFALPRPNGQGLTLPQDRWGLKLLRAFAAHPHWHWREKRQMFQALCHLLLSPKRLKLLKSLALEDLTQGHDMSVQTFFQNMPEVLMREVLEPLCVSALNTPIHCASARLFLRVLKKSMSDVPHSCELWLPKVPLSELLATPALNWLESQGAHLHLSTRITALEDFDRDDSLILATSAPAAGKLCAQRAPTWSRLALGLEHQGVCTLYLSAKATTSALNSPALMALHTRDQLEAQFAIMLLPKPEDSDRLHFALVCSASPMSERTAFCEAMRHQAQEQIGLEDLRIEHFVHEKRATFSALVSLQRPPMVIDSKLVAAGDYVQGPYPSTLEGAVISGQRAIEKIHQWHLH